MKLIIIAYPIFFVMLISACAPWINMSSIHTPPYYVQIWSTDIANLFQEEDVDNGNNGYLYADSDNTLYQGYWVTSPNGAFRLIMQQDGNLVLYHMRNNVETEVLWASETYGKPAIRCTLEKNGNFVLYDADGKIVWQTDTSGYDNAKLLVKNDGNLVIYGIKYLNKITPIPYWSTNTAHRFQEDDVYLGNDGYMYPNKKEHITYLTEGFWITSGNGKYQLTLQNGRLLLYHMHDKSRAEEMWASTPDSTAATRCTIKVDGNLVLDNNNDNPDFPIITYWSSSTSGVKDAYLLVQNDGNVVIYGSGATGLEPITLNN